MEQSLRLFQAETGTEDGDVVCDFICDLLHYAQLKLGQDPLEELRRGVEFFVDERDYPPDGWAPDDKMAHVTIDLFRGPL